MYLPPSDGGCLCFVFQPGSAVTKDAEYGTGMISAWSLHVERRLLQSALPRSSIKLA